MSIKMKKSDLAIAFSVIALIFAGVLVGLASCQNPIESLDIGTPTTGVDTGSVWIGGGSGSPKTLAHFTVTGGYTGPATITYYNPPATLNVTVTATGLLEYDASLAKPAGAVKSIEAAGNKHWIGRAAPTAGSSITLNLNTVGTLALRTAGSGGIPIGSYAEFQLINDNSGGMGQSYKQEADLDLMGGEPGVPAWTPVGTTLAQAFDSVYDGGGKKLTRLRINDSGSTEALGLFGYVSGEVKNLGIDSGEVKGGDNVGGVAGYIDGGAITACYNKAKVEGNDNVGGVAGLIDGGTITTCYNTGEVKGNDNVGGVAGVTNDEITACYNTGIVNGNAYTGGIAGDNGGDVNSSHWKSGVAPSRDGNNASEIIGEFTVGSFPDLSADPNWATSADDSSGFWRPATTGGGATLPKLWFE